MVTVTSAGVVVARGAVPSGSYLLVLDGADTSDAARVAATAVQAADFTSATNKWLLTEFRKHFTATMRPRLSELASEFLAELTDGRYTAVEIGED